MQGVYSHRPPKRAKDGERGGLREEGQGGIAVAMATVPDKVRATHPSLDLHALGVGDDKTVRALGLGKISGYCPAAK